MTDWRTFSFFTKNQARWRQLDPQGAAKLALTHGKPAVIADTSPDELQRWRAALPLQNCSLLLVYGVGTGQHYHSLISWLQADPQRYVVFFESEADRLTAFLSTAAATQLLADEQAWLYYTPTLNDQSQKLADLALAYPQYTIQTAALPWQAEHRALESTAIHTAATFIWNNSKTTADEYQHCGAGLLRHFYHNLGLLPQSLSGNDLKGLFHGLPAIVCGAGPSLNKNRHQLAALQDRALLLSGGTAINALNAAGLHPHLGFGIDPNPSSYHRILTSTSWHIPFLYYYRMHHRALSHVQSDKLLMYLKNEITVPAWFHQQLGLATEESIQGSFYNVLNFCTLAAIVMGCNPIIFVGIDLAYSEDASYAAGLSGTATYSVTNDFRTKRETEEIILRRDIYGKPVKTLWKWIAEAVWYGQLHLSHRHLTFINATEGGLGFPHIPNQTLTQVQESYLQRQWDVSDCVHAAVQRCQPICQGLSGNLKKTLETFLASVDACEQLISAHNYALLAAPSPLPEQWQTAPLPERQTLASEPAFEHLLAPIDNFIHYGLAQAFLRLSVNEEPTKSAALQQKKRHLHNQRYRHLLGALKQQQQFIQSALHNLSIDKKNSPSLYPLPTSYQEGTYRYQNGIVTIQEPALGIDFQDTTPQLLEEKTLTDATGNQLNKAHYTQKGLLHGPSSSYSQDGRLLATSWYFNGHKQGFTRLYWNSGALYAVIPYIQGRYHSCTYYFYEDGSLRSQIAYHNGKLQGLTLLYHSNGQIHRSVTYEQGLPHGLEQVWHSNGTLVLKASYQHGKPIGEALEWFPNGILSRRYLYNPDSKLISFQQWNEQGLLVPDQPQHKDPYLHNASQRIEELYSAIQILSTSFTTLTKALQTSPSEPVQQELLTRCREDQDALCQYTTSLIDLRQKLDPSQQTHSQDTNEPLWKTAHFMQEIDNSLKNLSDDLQTYFKHLAHWQDQLKP